MPTPDIDRKQRGAWFTPDHLVQSVVAAVVDEEFVSIRAGRSIRVLDPACGDGRFLLAAGAAIESFRGSADLVGVDIDRATIDSISDRSGIETLCADALSSDRLVAEAASFDLVIGNPPYLSQMAASTTRGGSSERGGGPYADAAVDFVALGADLVRSDGGRLAFVLPQSILSARDASAVRTAVDARATMFWSAWTGERDFDAQVVTCAVAFEFGTAAASMGGNWSHVVTSRSGVPAMPELFDDPHPAAGRLGDRARLNANFRDEYYGMIPAVGDHAEGPPLVTSGLIDPGRCLWGERDVRFAKQRFRAPRIDLTLLEGKMPAWAKKRLVPKVLIANQTPIIEAVCDPGGDWLPGVPVVAAYPEGTPDVVQCAWEIAAVLSAPAVSVWAWHQRGGTGLSPNTIRVGPTMLAELPWPSGSLTSAVGALRAGDVVACGRLVDVAYGLTDEDQARCLAWWKPLVDRIQNRA
ncbi:MAG: SAM-dependent methyltransferase [Ilumatobacter sp.]|jgi:SAM-dependent methyltransferase